LELTQEKIEDIKEEIKEKEKTLTDLVLPPLQKLTFNR